MSGCQATRRTAADPRARARKLSRTTPPPMHRRPRTTRHANGRTTALRGSARLRLQLDELAPLIAEGGKPEGIPDVLLLFDQRAPDGVLLDRRAERVEPAVRKEAHVLALGELAPAVVPGVERDEVSR